MTKIKLLLDRYLGTVGGSRIIVEPYPFRHNGYRYSNRNHFCSTLTMAYCLGESLKIEWLIVIASVLDINHKLTAKKTTAGRVGRNERIKLTACKLNEEVCVPLPTSGGIFSLNQTRCPLSSP